MIYSKRMRMMHNSFRIGGWIDKCLDFCDYFLKGISKTYYTKPYFFRTS
jgi:hypothetical protein